jgi:hypothetical protein
VWQWREVEEEGYGGREVKEEGYGETRQLRVLVWEEKGWSVGG